MREKKYTTFQLPSAAVLVLVLLQLAGYSAELTRSPLAYKEQTGGLLYYCDGTSVTFTATPSNPPPKPAGNCCDAQGNTLSYSLDETRYQWYVNGEGAGNSTSASKTVVASRQSMAVACQIQYQWSCNGKLAFTTESIGFGCSVYGNLDPCYPSVPNGNANLAFGNIQQLKAQAAIVTHWLTEDVYYWTGTWNNVTGREYHEELGFQAPSGCGGTINASSTPTTFSASGSLGLGYNNVSGSLSVGFTAPYTSQGYGVTAQKHIRLYARRFKRMVQVTGVGSFSGTVSHRERDRWTGTWNSAEVIDNANYVTNSVTGLPWEPVIGGITLMTCPVECCADETDGAPSA